MCFWGDIEVCHNIAPTTMQPSVLSCLLGVVWRVSFWGFINNKCINVISNEAYYRSLLVLDNQQHLI